MRSGKFGRKAHDIHFTFGYCFSIATRECSAWHIYLRVYLFSEDSVPVENAHLINYRTTKITTTDQYGHFRTWVKDDDSLMINHISLAPKVIHAKRTKHLNLIYVPNRTYHIQSVSNMDFKRKRAYALRNMQLINDKLSTIQFRDTAPKTMNVNPYDDEKISQGINLKGFLQLFKKRKRHK